jgi:drug/metabolite transporter (DMT)-like permease
MQNRNTLGVAFLCSGVLVYSRQDAIIKQVSGDYAVTQALFIRSLVAVPLLICFVQVETGIRAIKSSQFGWLTIRSFTLFVSYIAYYMAFPALPLSEAVALYFTVPLFITGLAGPLLGEKVEWTSWLAVFAGFAGVLIILQPGTALFEPAALFSLLSALLYGLCAIWARRPRSDRAGLRHCPLPELCLYGRCGSCGTISACCEYPGCVAPEGSIPYQAMDLANCR